MSMMSSTSLLHRLLTSRKGSTLLAAISVAIGHPVGKNSTSLKVFVRQQQPLGCNNDGTAADRAWQITFKQWLDHYRPRTPDASLRSSTATTASRTRTSMVQGASRAEVGLEKMMDFPRKKTKMESLSGHDQKHCRVLLWNQCFHDLTSQCPLLIANDLNRMD